MKITLRILGHLKDVYFDGKDLLEVEVSKPLTLLEILDKINLPPTMAMAYLKNGNPINKETILKGGEEIIILSPLSGG
ncbi:MAG: hypothetical protein DDT40_01587 [candidate division WS2 bacterium]|uniref:MoaD/ThiS family protein n=1 Tax=Psychracetigena formicireducens TaxID=2986056 RepID=A0A9E2F1K6_PSYF1|nr:hypothetical protein [Candidatus Psychracetigena formicireducens]MBT9145544.1 hypothetical protein [Candidatus Psychracetigena formicireducens]MBT9151394.1 hypothetical protein [Candidatus Psychracetigena formicireducens]